MSLEDEERKRIAAERKAAYRKRKKAEALAGLSNNLPKQTPQELAIKVAQAHGLPTYGTPTPEAEESWKQVQVGKPISAEEIVHYVDSREKAEAVQAEAVAREEYVNHLFSKYEKNTNIPRLLQGIIREQIETRVVLIDLLAEILNEVRK